MTVKGIFLKEDVKYEEKWKIHLKKERRKERIYFKKQNPNQKNMWL